MDLFVIHIVKKKIAVIIDITYQICFFLVFLQFYANLFH